MDNTDTLVTKLTSIGDAIRTKTDNDHLLTLDDMPQKIMQLKISPFENKFNSKDMWRFIGDPIQITTSSNYDRKGMNAAVKLFEINELDPSITSYNDILYKDCAAKYFINNTVPLDTEYVYIFGTTASPTNIYSASEVFLLSQAQSYYRYNYTTLYQLFNYLLGDIDTLPVYTNTTKPVISPYYLYKIDVTTNIYKATKNDVYIMSNGNKILVDTIG